MYNDADECSPNGGDTIIFSLFGEDKSAKSTLALSFPRPLVYLELDIGGFQRACRNLPHLPIKDWFDKGEIKVEPYVIPFQIGQLDAINSTVRSSKIVVGMKELFYKLAGSFIQHTQDNTATIVVDGTLLYELTCQGFLQEKQEQQIDSKGNVLPGEKLRVSLLPLEYREPYTRMRGFIYNAKASGKNVVLMHHATDEYAPMPQRDGSVVEGRTGKRVRHGWQQLGDSADVMVHCWWKDAKKDAKGTVLEPGKPFCRVELAEVKELEGMTFEEPTWDKIAKVISMLRGDS
jgi:hypothetical protein